MSGRGMTKHSCNGEIYQTHFLADDVIKMEAGSGAGYVRLVSLQTLPKQTRL